MAVDYYSTSRPTQLAVAMSNVDTAVLVADGVTYPDPGVTGKQYTIIIGYGSDREEICTVIAKPNATTLTVIRAQDGTPGTAKNIGDIVVHGVSARDFKRFDAIEADIVALEAADVALAAADTALQATDTALQASIVALQNTDAALQATDAALQANKLNLDGTQPMTGDLAMGTHLITGLKTGTANDHAINKGQADAAYVDVVGDTMSGHLKFPINVGVFWHLNNRIIFVGGDSQLRIADAGGNFAPLQIGSPIDGNSAARVDWVGGNYAPINHGYHPKATGTTVFVTNASGQGIINTGVTFSTVVQCNGDFSSHDRAVSLRGDYPSNSQFGLMNMDPNKAVRCNWIAT